MKMPQFTGLVAATYTPFQADGALNLPMVEQQAAHLLAHGVKLAFIGGSTGECASLTLEERRALAERWFAVARGSALRIMVHVGANALSDARMLAAQAEQLGAAAVSAFAPSYFKPTNVDALVACCADIAEAAPATPFYFYDIPALTGVHLPMPEFLARAAGRIPNLAGLKFTNSDLMAYQFCRESHGRRFDVLWGCDEALLAALVLGARGAVGSTYNFAAPIYHRLLAAFERGDVEAARGEQYRSVQLVRVLAARGYMGCAKAVMGMLGVNVGPARLPNGNPSAEQVTELRQELEQLGLFERLRL